MKRILGSVDLILDSTGELEEPTSSLTLAQARHERLNRTSRGSHSKWIGSFHANAVEIDLAKLVARPSRRASTLAAMKSWRDVPADRGRRLRALRVIACGEACGTDRTHQVYVRRRRLDDVGRAGKVLFVE